MGGTIQSMSDMRTVTQRLQYLSQTDPNKEMFVFYRNGQRDAYTSSDLLTLGGRFASRLQGRGFKKGDVIANILSNSPERVVTDVGIMLAGCITMNIQLLLADGSDFFLSAKNSKCPAVIMSGEGESPAVQLLSSFITGTSGDEFHTFCADEIPDLKTAIVICRNGSGPGSGFLHNLKNSQEDIWVCPAEPDDLLAIVTTSGSTGYSKLVHRSHFEILEYERINQQSVSPGVAWPNAKEKQFKYYSDRPLGWSAGITFGSICYGDTRYQMDIFDSSSTKCGRKLWEVVVAEDIRHCCLLCLEMDNVLEHVESTYRGDHRFTSVFTGGQPLSKSQMEKFLKLSDELKIFYGSTEAGVLSMYTRKTDDILETNNSGKVVEDVEIRIVTNEGRPCAAGQVGTIEVRGPLVFKGYFNQLKNPDPESVKAFTPDGWFLMQDYGFLNDQGELYVFGRSKDVIVYGADLFYPGWMEKKLKDHPDILEAIVVPVSDPVLYQNICACVKVRKSSSLDEEQLKLFCQKIFLPNLGAEDMPTPKYFIVTKDAFPETSRGKPNRKKLRELAEEKFGILSTA